MTEIPYVYTLCSASYNTPSYPLIYGAYRHVRISNGEIMNQDNRIRLHELIDHSDWGMMFQNKGLNVV